MRAVILAGGKGTRLMPYTKVFPKPLVPVGEKPILKHFGFTHTTLAVGYMADMIQAYVHNGGRYGIDIEYVLEDEPLGTAGPLAQVKKLEESFLVMNGDVITNLDYGDLFKFHKSEKAVATIGSYEKSFQIELGIIQNDHGHIISDYIEKPVHIFQVSMGIYVFEPTVLQYVEPQKYLDFPDLIRYLLDDGHKVISYPFEGYWLDIGNHSDYEKSIEQYDEIKGELNLE